MRLRIQLNFVLDTPDDSDISMLKEIEPAFAAAARTLFPKDPGFGGSRSEG